MVLLSLWHLSHGCHKGPENLLTDIDSEPEAFASGFFILRGTQHKSDCNYSAG